MNERIKELEKQCWNHQTNHLDSEKFAELILRKCIGIAEAQALQSTKMANSEFVTPTGRTLYEGMFGGAMNVALGIRERFELKDN